eukprot:Awhi_evm1s2020
MHVRRSTPFLLFSSLLFSSIINCSSNTLRSSPLLDEFESFEVHNIPFFEGEAAYVPAHKRDVSARIIGGVAASVDETPWMVSLRRNGYHYCGGSLISESHILTAAHCINTFEILFHEVWIQGKASNIRTITDFVCHAAFSQDTFSSDICVLTLSSPVEATPISLDDEDLGSISFLETTVFGWGLTSEGGLISDDLMHVTVPIVPLEACQISYGSQIEGGMLCAGEDAGGKDGCQGDSGGPLKLINRDVQIGIVSWGEGCGRPGKYGVYTHIHAYIPWLEENNIPFIRSSQQTSQPEPVLASSVPQACNVEGRQCAQFNGMIMESAHQGRLVDNEGSVIVIVVQEKAGYNRQSIKAFYSGPVGSRMELLHLIPEENNRLEFSANTDFVYDITQQMTMSSCQDPGMFVLSLRTVPGHQNGVYNIWLYIDTDPCF